MAGTDPAVPADGQVRPPRVTGWSTWEGSHGGDLLPGSKLLANENQLNSFLESVGQQPDTLDFKQYGAVLAFAGERATGGYSIEMDAVPLGDDLLIRWRVLCTPADAMTTQVITRPWHLAAFLRPKGQVQVIQMEDRVLPSRGSAQ